MKEKVLFICVHNSARSQMAAAFLNHLCPGDFIAESAGLEPGELNPLVVEAMAEIGIDISGRFPNRYSSSSGREGSTPTSSPYAMPRAPSDVRSFPACASGTSGVSRIPPRYRAPAPSGWRE
jgi:hypothetical protein